MNFILQTLLSYLLLYKYLALFSITYLAALFLPIPAAATVIASSAFAGQGYFNLFWVILVASLGNILGDNTGYWLARRYGQTALHRIGLRQIINSPILNFIEEQVRRHQSLVIFFSRFEVLATLSVNLISGLGKIKYINYLTCEIAGEITQVILYVAVGYLFGSNWQAINNLVGNFSLIILLAILLFIVFFGKKIIQRITGIRPRY